MLEHAWGWWKQTWTVSGGRVEKVEDRVGRIFTIHVTSLDHEVWLDMGDAATVGALADRGGSLAQAGL